MLRAVQQRLAGLKHRAPQVPLEPDAKCRPSGRVNAEASAIQSSERTAQTFVGRLCFWTRRVQRSGEPVLSSFVFLDTTRA